MCNFTKINQQVPRLVLCFMIFCMVDHAQCQLNDFLGVESWMGPVGTPSFYTLCISSLRLVLGHVKVLWGSKVLRTGDLEVTGTRDASLPELSCHL